MSEPNSISPRKLITIPLIDYLEALWGPSRDIAYVDIDKATLISTLDSDEQLCHVRMPSLELGIKVPEVWRKPSWDADTLSRSEQRLRAQIHQAKIERWKEARDKLADAYISMFIFNSSEREEAKKKATTVLNKHQIVVAKCFGVDIKEFADEKFTYYEIGDQYKLKEII